MPSTVFQRPVAAAAAAAGEHHSPPDDVHFLAPPPALASISEHACLRSLSLVPPRDSGAHRLPRRPVRRPPSRPLMATLSYPHDAHAFGGPPGSPPDLTNSKSSKSSSFHSSTPSDFGPADPTNLSHFEDINLDEAAPAPAVFPVPLSPSTRVIFDARPAPAAARSLSHTLPAHHPARDLTTTPKPRHLSLAANAAHRPPAQLTAPAKPLKKGFTSCSAPTLTALNLAAPHRPSRSPSPANTAKSSAAPRALSRRSSRNDALPSPSLMSRRQSCQDAKRKTVKELEAECDEDGDDELPEDAYVWNIPVSPRPLQARTPSSVGSMPSPNPDVANQVQASSRKTSPAHSLSRRSSRPSPAPSSRNNSPSNQLVSQPTNTWDQIHTSLDADARALTEALEAFQTELERKQVIERQQPGLARSASLSRSEPKSSKKAILPPVRKSDPLIDPFQPSAEKQKYLSRTRPSWLPPKDPKEEKKHLKEYQKMLARMEENERLEAQRAQEEAIAHEKATRIKAEYWSTLLLPNWATEMDNPELRNTHRKMWWNGIPPRLRGQVWSHAIGNELGVSAVTYSVALSKATPNSHVASSTADVWPSLKMFAPDQPLHQDLIDVCLAYSTYRPDMSGGFSASGIQHIAALLLLNLSPPDAFTTLSNLLNRPLPLSFLVQDYNAMHAAYSTTLDALAMKHASLAARLETLRVEPNEYLADMFASLFCSRLSVEHAARVMDLYAIEGDKIPPRVAVAVLGILEGSCIEGNKEDVTDVLKNKTVEIDVEDFVARVYEAGKTS
ncbi:hypothetical protein ACEQ8H_000182 [Pleosporales sp. CAS-2024a]